MFELWLVRHGISNGNIEGWVTGDTEVPLTEEGKYQAKTLGKWLTNSWGFEPDIFVTSTMVRAIQTAELLGINGSPVRYADLNETDAGDVSFWKRERFDAEHPDFWEPFDAVRPFPGGESHMDLYDRVTRCMRKIASESHHGSKVLLVSHGGTISSIFHHAYNVPMSYFSKFVVDNGSLSILKYTDFDTPPELIAYNEMPPENDEDNL